MEVKHTVFDPRRLKLDRSTHRPGGFFDLPAHTRSTPPSRDGFPRPGSRGDTGARRLKPIPESGWGSASGQDFWLLMGAEPVEPWRSPAVVDFALGLDQGRLDALVLQGPRGTALRAAGEAADHQVASKAVAEIEAQRQNALSSGVEGPRADATELPRFNAARRNAVPRGEDLALSKLAVPRAPLAFGAVYEYRDACGTAKVVASTATMPEKQYALDQRHYEHRLPKRDPQLVWVGLTGGRGGLNEAEMASVRRRVADARAERLNAKKLSDIKPYSRALGRATDR
ncbi:Uncharacterized protein SCF082_LOCUS26697 [Durusdinium trenchii]|uniref:Uncharacterized protein n=1 Tax=Durusdinium trenchii TaxID=1381693 RepID=A0ABP0M8C6_9DINO